MVPVARRWQRKGGAKGAAKFREETSKKADSAVEDRIAAVHNVAMPRQVSSVILHCSTKSTWTTVLPTGSTAATSQV
jgi:hypothetical protein